MFLVWGNSQEIAAIIDQGTISIWGEETTKGDIVTPGFKDKAECTPYVSL